MTRIFLGGLVLAVASLPLTALAQSAAAPAAATTGCGDAAVRYDVDTDRGLHPAPPQPGRALVYFIQDDRKVTGFLRPTTRVGVDGSWVGATHGNTYFFFFVDPGAHHLCASWQPSSFFAQGQKTMTVDFSAKAGATYYFQATNTLPGSSRAATISLTPLSNDEGFDLVDSGDYAYSLYKQRP